MPDFVQGEVVTAAKMNEIPKGVLGYAEVTDSQGTFTSETALTGLSATVTVAAGRVLKITGKAHFSASAAGPRVRLAVKESSTFLNTANIVIENSSQAESLIVQAVIVSPSAGGHTYHLTGTRENGSGDITMVATVSVPAFILVEDIGADPDA